MVRSNQKNSQKNAVNDAFDFIKRNYLIIGGLLIAIPYIKRYLDSQNTAIAINKAENEVKEVASKAELVKDVKLIQNQSALTQTDKRRKITTRTDLWSASSSLAHDLGVKYKDSGNWYDFLNPRGWTENDESVRKTLIYQRNNFLILEKLYYEVDTNSRNLRSDILQYLDKDELIQVRKYLNI